MVPSNRYMVMISLQQYAPESNHRYYLLEEQKWRYCHNQSLPGLCHAVTDHYPGINRLFQCYYRYFREHKYLPGASKLSGFDLLSISLFITLARGQICLLYSWKNLFMSLSIYKGAKKYKSHFYRKHGDHSNVLRTPHSECL